MNSFGNNGYGGLTQPANTAIQFLVPPMPGAFTRITGLVYTDATTSHTLTFLRSLGRTTASGANAAGGTGLNLTADPGPGSDTLASSDFIAIRELDGVTRVYKINSGGGKILVLTSALVAGTVGGESVWMFGVPGDTDPRTGAAHPNWPSNSNSTDYTLPASSPSPESVVCGSLSKDEPILFNSNNATNAGKLKMLAWCYTLV